jgi:hypothetical protein
MNHLLFLHAALTKGYADARNDSSDVHNGRDCVCVGETKTNPLLMVNGDVIEPTSLTVVASPFARARA